MIFKIFFISLFSLQFLVACGGGSGETADPTTMDLDALPDNGVVGFNALSSPDIEYSVCLPNVPTFRELNDYYFNKALGEPISDIYFDYIISENEFGSQESTLSFLGQNQDVYEVLEALLFNVKNVTQDDLNNNSQYVPLYLSPRKDVYKQVRGFCRDIQCAADSIFGDSWGLRFLLKDKFGIVLSGYVDPQTEEFADNEQIHSIVQAVLSLPQGTFPLNKDVFTPDAQEFGAHNVIIAPYVAGASPSAQLANAAGVTNSIRMGRGESSLLYNADIYLLDPWKQAREHYQRMATVFHELIHVLDQAKEKNVVLSQTEEWLKISDWKQNPQTQQWFMVKDNLKCSEYGATLPQEDFAECGSLYRFAPKRLKQISKAKYNFFKKRVFNGIEYHQLSKCEKSVPKIDLSN